MNKKHEAIIVTLVLSIIMFTFAGVMFGGMTGYSVGGQGLSGGDAGNDGRGIDGGIVKPQVTQTNPNEGGVFNPDGHLLVNVEGMVPAKNLDRPECKGVDCLCCGYAGNNKNGGNNQGGTVQFRQDQAEYFAHGSNVVITFETNKETSTGFEDLSNVFVTVYRFNGEMVSVTDYTIVSLENDFEIIGLLAGKYKVVVSINGAETVRYIVIEGATFNADVSTAKSSSLMTQVFRLFNI